MSPSARNEGQGRKSRGDDGDDSGGGTPTSSNDLFTDSSPLSSSSSSSPWTEFEFTVEAARNKLKKGIKVTSPPFTSPGPGGQVYTWTVGVHFGGHGEGRPTHIACFLEMVPSPPPPARNNSRYMSSNAAARYEEQRHAKFQLDIRDVHSGLTLGTSDTGRTRRTASEEEEEEDYEDEEEEEEDEEALWKHTRQCGVLGEASFSSTNAKDGGFVRFCHRDLFLARCVNDEDEAVFTCRVKSDEGPPAPAPGFAFTLRLQRGEDAAAAAPPMTRSARLRLLQNAAPASPRRGRSRSASASSDDDDGLSVATSSPPLDYTPGSPEAQSVAGLRRTTSLGPARRLSPSTLARRRPRLRRRGSGSIDLPNDDEEEEADVRFPIQRPISVEDDEEEGEIGGLAAPRSPSSFSPPPPPVVDMVGLENQGATCYLNSLIQTLFHLPELRRHVYAIDTSLDSLEEGVALEIQHVFADLQLGKRAASTERLTKAFGWTDSQVFIQHDVQEMLRELLDKLEKRIQADSTNNTTTSDSKIIAKLFSAQYETYVRCTGGGGFTSSRVEEFFDVSLDVQGFRSVAESFESYCKEEELVGDNQYDAPAEHGGKQDALKGVRFCSFPPVLHLHLKRFAYNFDLDKAYKIHDRFDFPELLDLNKFVAAPRAKKEGEGEEEEKAAAIEYTYKLHSVLVHSGNDQRGHYYVYIRVNGEWFKFNDETVTRVRRSEAVEGAFGGSSFSPSSPSNNNNNKRWRSSGDSSASAYMLVYIRESMWAELTRPVDSSVPEQLSERFAKQAELKRAKQRELDKAKYSGKVKVCVLEDFDRLTQLSAEKQRDGTLLAVLDLVDWSRLVVSEEIDIGDMRHCTNASMYVHVTAHLNCHPALAVKEGEPPHEWRLWRVEGPSVEGSARIKEEVSWAEGNIVKNWMRNMNKLFAERLPRGASRTRRPGDIALFFREYHGAGAGAMGRTTFLGDTGLSHGRSTLRDVHRVLRDQVLLASEKDDEYDLYDLFDLQPSAKGEDANAELRECSDAYLSTDTMSIAGDILVYAKREDKEKQPQYTPFPDYAHRIAHSTKLTLRALNTMQKWELPETVSLLDCVNDAVCKPLAKLVGGGRDANSIAIILNGEPLRKDYDVMDLIRLVWNSNVKHKYLAKCILAVSLLPFARDELEEHWHVHLVAHLPVPRAAATTATSSSAAAAVGLGALHRGDTPLGVAVFLPCVQQQLNGNDDDDFGSSTSSSSRQRPRQSTGAVSLAAILDEIRERTAPVLAADAAKSDAASPPRRVVLLHVVDCLPTLVDTDAALEDVLDGEAVPTSWSVVDFDGNVILPSNPAYDTRWYAELLDAPAEGEAALMRVVHASSLGYSANVHTESVPTVCPLVENDTLGKFWKRLLARLCITNTKTQWRPLMVVPVDGDSDRAAAFGPKQVVFLDLPPPPPSSQSTSGSGEGGAAAAAGRRTAAVPSPLPESGFDALPLWTHPALARFVQTRNREHLPILYLLHPATKSLSTNLTHQTSLTIRSS